MKEMCSEQNTSYVMWG